MSVSESQTNVVYKVDNCTGPLVDVKKWLDDQEWKAKLNLRAECRREWVCGCCYVFDKEDYMCRVLCVHQFMWCSR